MRISPDVLQAIRRHGQTAYPEECCGFLLGEHTPDGNRVQALHAADNRHPEQRTRRYALPPDAYRAAEETARQQQLEVVGFYHSHPDHPAHPSDTDLAEATFPGYTYIIVSVQDGMPSDLTAWTLSPDRSSFTEEEVVPS